MLDECISLGSRRRLIFVLILFRVQSRVGRIKHTYKGLCCYVLMFGVWQEGLRVVVVGGGSFEPPFPGRGGEGAPVTGTL